MVITSLLCTLVWVCSLSSKVKHLRVLLLKLFTVVGFHLCNYSSMFLILLLLNIYLSLRARTYTSDTFSALKLPNLIFHSNMCNMMAVFLTIPIFFKKKTLAKLIYYLLVIVMHLKILKYVFFVWSVMVMDVKSCNNSLTHDNDGVTLWWCSIIIVNHY